MGRGDDETQDPALRDPVGAVRPGREHPCRLQAYLFPASALLRADPAELGRFACLAADG